MDIFPVYILYCALSTLTVSSVGESDGSSDATGGVEQTTLTGVGQTVSAADRRHVTDVPRTVVDRVTAQAVRQTELIHDARLTGRTYHAGTRRYSNSRRQHTAQSKRTNEKA